MSLTISAGSLSQFRAELARAGAKVDRACNTALYLEAEAIMTDSRPLVPWLSGVLRASGYVHPASANAVEFGYGGAAEAYAMVQHEHEEFNHPRGGQAKYLLTAIEQHAVNLDSRLAAHVRRVI
mgnify:CR=1 FL=1